VIPDYAEADADVRAVVPKSSTASNADLAVAIKNKLIADTEVTATLSRTFP